MLRRQITIGHGRRLAAGICCLGLSTLFGCGDGKIPRYPVSGKVLVDSKPAAGAMLIFCPVTGSDELMRERPIGFTGADGTFRLTTFVNNDGAPAGEYRVLAHWAASNPTSTNEDPERASTPPDRLKGKYFNLEKTPLTATVTEGTNDLPPFELSTK